jgi:hypothetical protein
MIKDYAQITSMSVIQQGRTRNNSKVSNEGTHTTWGITADTK